jgi:hypothetical protein
MHEWKRIAGRAAYVPIDSLKFFASERVDRWH